MYKLTVVAGPNRGTSFAVQDGENSIGRQAGNSVVLPSAKVSKRHCVLVVSQDDVFMQDQGSSNGTFVNGVLAKARRIKAGDRISVGEYVLELTQPRAPSSSPHALGGALGNVIQFPGQPRLPSGDAGAAGGDSSSLPAPGSQMPTDLKGKAVWFFDHNVMPIFYGLLLKHEWRVICVSAFALFAVGNLFLSVYPLIEQNRASLVKEVGKRATFMARQIAERNAPYLAARAETKTEIGSIESAEGVRVAVLTDMDNRILAPGTRLNQYLSSGEEGAMVTRARNVFRERDGAGGFVRETDGMVIAVEPVRILSQQAGRNVTVGMAVVSIDTTLSTPDFGEMGMTYSETLILTAVLGGIILLVLYRLTLKPFQVLNEEMDKALKGEIGQVTHEFKFEETDPLWDIINSALQRIPKGGDSLGGFGGGGGSAGAEDVLGLARMLGGMSRFGVLLCDGDRKVVHMNPVFEEMSGIRLDGALGQDFAAIARDQSFAPFLNDLFDRASGGSEVAEDYDFSGIGYRMHAAAVGSPARGYLLVAAKAEG